MRTLLLAACVWGSVSAAHHPLSVPDPEQWHDSITGERPVDGRPTVRTPDGVRQGIGLSIPAPDGRTDHADHTGRYLGFTGAPTLSEQLRSRLFLLCTEIVEYRKEARPFFTTLRRGDYETGY